MADQHVNLRGIFVLALMCFLLQTGGFSLQTAAASAVSSASGAASVNQAASGKKVSRAKSRSSKAKTTSARKILMTGNRDIDYLVELHLKKAGVKETMTDKEILRRIYEYITLHCNYPYAILKIHYRYSSASIRKAASKYKKECRLLEKSGQIRYRKSLPTTGVGDLWQGTGNCIVHARTFALMAAHMGIKCGYVRGTGHSWACAWVNGVKYYFDPGYSIHYYYAHRRITKQYFMMTPAYARSHGHTPHHETIYK